MKYIQVHLNFICWFNQMTLINLNILIYESNRMSRSNHLQIFSLFGRSMQIIFALQKEKHSIICDCILLFFPEIRILDGRMSCAKMHVICITKLYIHNDNPVRQTFSAVEKLLQIPGSKRAQYVVREKVLWTQHHKNFVSCFFIGICFVRSFHIIEISSLNRSGDLLNTAEYRLFHLNLLKQLHSNVF